VRCLGKRFERFGKFLRFVRFRSKGSMSSMRSKGWKFFPIIFLIYDTKKLRDLVSINNSLREFIQKDTIIF
jgi:hypothetical protein